MKKTVSMMLAILVAAITVCTFATSAFANPEITVPSDDRFNPVTTTKATTTAAPTTTATTTAAPTTTATTTAAPTTAATTAAEEKGGCGSSISIAALAIVPVLACGAAFVGKKKED